MEKADQTTGIANCLLVPDDFFFRAVALIQRLVFVLLNTELLVGLANGEDEEQGMGRAGHEGEQLGLVDAEDVVECKLLRQPKLVDESGHDFWVVL